MLATNLSDNCRNLAKAMVRVEDGSIVIEAPINPRLQRQSRVVFEPEESAHEICEDLRRVLYDLLTAVADDVQDRFYVNRAHEPVNGRRPPKDPDEIIGINLPSGLQAQKASNARQATLDVGSD